MIRKLSFLFVSLFAFNAYAGRPTNVPEWADISSNIAQPPTLQLQTGWNVNQIPPSKYQNWWQNVVYQWQQYFDGSMAATGASGGTSTLSVTSSDYQALTGSASQTYKLPDETTLGIGRRFHFFNLSTGGTLTVTDSAATVLIVLGPGTGGYAPSASFYAYSTSAATGHWVLTANVANQLAGPITRVQSAALSLTSATPANLCSTASISLTSGTWIVGGSTFFIHGGNGTPNLVIFQAAVSKTSGTLPATDTVAVPTSGEVTYFHEYSSIDTVDETLAITPYVYTVPAGSPVSLYLVVKDTHSNGTTTAAGSLYAERLH
jgi:hypothetical protein